MSCNPAMGGLGKDHLIRETCNGWCYRSCFRSFRNSRMLNKTRGEAVQGPRAQIDRDLYKKYKKIIAIYCDVVEDEVIA